MKRLLFLFISIFLSTVTNAQSYSVWFTSPSNYSTVAGTVNDNSRSDINLSFSWSGQKVNQQNKWKFNIIKDIITGGGDTYDETWVYEDTPYCTLRGDILSLNNYLIKMYEEDYITKALTYRATSSDLNVIVMQTVYVDNNFGTGNISVNNSIYSSGSSFNLSPNSSLNVAAIENQTDSQGYRRVWNASGTYNSYWDINGVPYAVPHWLDRKRP